MNVFIARGAASKDAAPRALFQSAQKLLRKNCSNLSSAFFSHYDPAFVEMIASMK